MVPLKKLLTYLPSIVNLDTILLSNEQLEKAYLKSTKCLLFHVTTNFVTPLRLSVIVKFLKFKTHGTWISLC